VYYDGCLYGIHGREDLGRADLRCIDALTGKVLWSQDGYGMAHLIRVGDQLLVLGVGGRLVLAKASREGFQPLARAVVSGITTRALPALSESRLYVRENGGRQGALRCFQLADRVATEAP
jgi:hypothetical protein